MRVYRKTTVTVERDVSDGWKCDGCGLHIAEGDDEPIEVIISVGDGMDGGGVDTFDLCDDCLVQRAPHLTAAGSTVRLVTGEERAPDA